jgi:hypothetical protein
MNSPGSDVTVFFLSFLGWGWDWAHLVRRPVLGLLYQPRIVNDDECRADGGMRIGRGNRSTWTKPVSLPLYKPQIPYDLTWDGTWDPAVGSRPLTDWAMTHLRRVRSYDERPATSISICLCLTKAVALSYGSFWMYCQSLLCCGSHETCHFMRVLNYAYFTR